MHPDRGGRPRLPRRLGLEGVPGDRDASAASRCRRACARATGSRSRSSRRRRRPRLGEHDENIAFDAMVAIVGGRCGRACPRPSALRAVRLCRRGHRARPGSCSPTRSSSSGSSPTSGELAAHRRGLDARLVALLGCRDLRARSPAGELRQAVRPRLARGPAVGQDGARARPCPTTSSRAPAPATSRPTSGSPAPASSATSRRT